MSLCLLFTTLDQEDCGENQEAPGYGCEPHVPEVVPQEGKQRYHSQAKPARPAKKGLVKRAVSKLVKAVKKVVSKKKAASAKKKVVAKKKPVAKKIVKKKKK